MSSGDNGFRQPHVCLSPTPSMAWALSGQHVDDVPEWDLWQVRLAADDSVIIRPNWGTAIEEVQVGNRIPKSRIWYVASRPGT